MAIEITPISPDVGVQTHHLTHFLIPTDGKLPTMTDTMRRNANVANREEARVQRLAEEMVTLHEEWAEIDAAQISASKVAKAPRVGKKIVIN